MHYRHTVGSDAARRDGEPVAEAVVVEAHGGAAVGVGGHVRVPIDGAAVVGLLRQRHSAVVGQVELCGAVDTLEVDAVAHELRQRASVLVAVVGYEVEDGALSILANFAEGSARDSLSLLDRALSHNNYEKLLTEKSVSEMLGLSSKKNIYDLFLSMLEGNVNKALQQFENIYSYSLDISALMQDLLNVNHNMIMAKTLNNFFETTHLPSDQVSIIKDTISKINLSSLMRVWKLLLKGEMELKNNFDAKKIMDIIIVNVCYGSRLPTLDEILKNEDKEEDKVETPTKNNNDELIENITNLFDGATVL